MKDDGGQVVLGGEPLDGPGHFFPPTVVTEVDSSAAVLSEELFAPLAPISTFDDDDEAISEANNTLFGLIAYAYTRDVQRAFRVSDALDAGMVGLNRGLISNAAAPFGGVKQSGQGREGGHEGILEFVESKYVSIPR
jgi:succinate-semialdehyde dehydrogenase/glutarate-semialdehyde dehydrogenase